MSAIQPRCPTLCDGVNRPNRAHLGCLAQIAMAGQFGVVLTAALARGIGRRTNPERAELLRAICPFARGLKKLGRSDELKDSPAADVRPIPPTRTSAIGPRSCENAGSEGAFRIPFLSAGANRLRPWQEFLAVFDLFVSNRLMGAR